MTNGDAAKELMHTLLKVQTTFRQTIQKSLKANKIDLTFEMLQILTLLWHQDGTNQQDLGVRTFKDKASLTSILNNLETKGLILRSEDIVDRRSKKIHLTAQGRLVGNQVKPVIDNIYREVGDRINRNKTAECISYLEELNNAFKQ